MPGEDTWPTQPFPTAPPPFARQSFTEKDLSPFIEDPAERAKFLEDIRGARNEGMFTPPGTRNTIEMPGNNGGANFGGAAVDPTRGMLVVVSKDYPTMLKLTAPSNTPPNADPRSIQYRSPFGFMVTSSGLAAIRPPWTTLTAYDLNAGTIRWQIPLGEVPELAAKGYKDTGSHYPKVGPVVTAGGLIFTGTRDRIIRALDVDTGKVLWQTQVAAGVEGIPAVYELNGKQYVAYCAGARATTHTHASPWHQVDDSPVPGAYVVFALPDAK
jgi:quinoprotein glucose dehydrogenase